jgi:hypothetical protein
MHRKRRRERLPLIISWKKGKRGKERTRGPWPSRDQHSGPYGYIGSAKNRRDSSSAATDPPRSSAKGEGLGPASSHIGGAHLPGPRSPGAAHRSGPSRPAKDYRSRPAARFGVGAPIAGPSLAGLPSSRYRAPLPPCFRVCLSLIHSLSLSLSPSLCVYCVYCVRGWVGGCACARVRACGPPSSVEPYLCVERVRL